MRDIFYEETVINANFDKQKLPHTVFKSIASISAITSVLWFVFNIFTIDFGAKGLFLKLILAIVPTALFILCAFISLKLSDNFCVEFDYVLVNDTLSFSKVIKNSRRINLFEIGVKKIEKIGIYSSANYLRCKSAPDVKEVYLTPNKTPINNNYFIYIYVVQDSKKKILILETRDELIKNMKLYLSNYAIDEELKK